jgi:methyl-accepting chemotaxis protein
MSRVGQPPRRRRLFRRGLFWQILLWSILPAAAVLAALAALRCWEHYQNRLAMSRAALRESAQTVANWLESKNSEAIGAARILTAVQRSGVFGQRKATLATMRKTMEELDRVAGITVAYEPLPVAQDTPPPAAPQQQEQAGQQVVRFVAGWVRDPSQEGELLQRLDTGMERSECYLLLKQRWEAQKVDLPIVGEPSVVDGRPTIEFACPIVSNGRFYGALKLDRLISDIHGEFDAIAKGGRVDIYVVSPGGRVIMASGGTGRVFPSDPASWSTKPVEGLPSGPVLRRLIASGSSGAFVDDPTVRSRSLFATASVPSGGWSVIVGVDESAVLSPIRREAMRTAGIAAAGIAALAVMAYVPARRTARRIRSAVQAAERVASGDLTMPPGGQASDDEVGDLLRALDRMTTDLGALVGRVHSASSSLRGTAAELSSGADRQRHAVSAFGASSSEIAGAVREITGTSQRLSVEMERVSSMALGTASRAQDGRAKLESMETAMMSLSDATGGVTERLSVIHGRATNIGGVVTTIASVAEKTNLLSVNASIEAERAGPYGLGFLVVAREIRRLADQTAQATLDIERIVREMQGAVSSGVADMDRFGQRVRENVTEARELSRSMSEIIGGVEEGTRSLGAVRDGIGRQAAGAAQISAAMNALSENAEASVRAAADFAGAAEVLNGSIASLDAAAAALRVRP